MRTPKQRLFLLILVIAMSSPRLAAARCDSSPDLSAPITEFESLQKSRIEALLRFGESQGLCLGLEYVDANLLTAPADIHIRNTSIRKAIGLILGQDPSLVIAPGNGIIEISRKQLGAETKNIFDYVLPRFEATRAPVQEISTALYMQLLADLDPQITGFAGHYPTGDPEDQAGPFSEYDRSLRYLLDTLVSQSKGGAWIARIPWKLRGDLTIAERHPVWTVIEYGLPKTGYASVLSLITADLQSDEALPSARSVVFTPTRPAYPAANKRRVPQASFPRLGPVCFSFLSALQPSAPE